LVFVSLLWRQWVLNLLEDSHPLLVKIFIVLFPANDMTAHCGFLVLSRKNGPVAYIVCGFEGYLQRGI
jgi:hypothetical protein